MATLLIVDASGYLYASYHAIQNMTNKKGESTNALFGFVNSLNKILASFDTPHIVVVFDGPDNSLARKALYKDYKATRKETPRDLPDQIKHAKEYCQLNGFPFVEIPGVEADDTMASIAIWASSLGHDILICTSDKDMCQIVNEKINLVNTRKDNKIIGPKEVEEMHGVPPSLIRDYLSIIGDASDNIPGLPGFGPKTAASLLREFGSLEAILKNPERINGAKKQEIVRENKDAVLLSKSLVTVDLQVPFEKPSELYTSSPPDVEGLKKFCIEFDFNSLLRTLAAHTPISSSIVESYIPIEHEIEFEEMIDLLSQQKEVCFDTKTTHPDCTNCDLVGLSFGWEPGKAWYIPVNGNLPKENVLEGLKKLFSKKDIKFYAHNGKYDCHILYKEGIEVPNLEFDTLIASYVLNAHQRQHSLDSLALQYFGKHKIPLSDLTGKGKAEISLDKIPLSNMYIYGCEDVDYTIRLRGILEKELEERKLIPLFKELELPLTRVLERMERKGIYLDREQLDAFGKELNAQITSLGNQIHAFAGKSFNLNSAQQLGLVLAELGIKTAKKTSLGMSTSADELEKIKDQHPIISIMLEYRSLEKLRSTYVESLPAQINPITHRIHCNFNQSVAATGRLSCQDPNLQNIPVRTEMGLRIREAFKPQQMGWSFLSADYSQIELRLLAHLCGDPHLIEAFEKKEDIHRVTASSIFQIPLESVTEQQRYQAKAVNFGILYGQQAYGLSQNLNISMKDADAFIQTYFARFPLVKEFLEGYKELARQTGKAVTLIGRERCIPEILSRNPQIRSAAERLAINTPIQGTAADLIKMAMLRVDKALRENNLKAFMILQIHDELIFEVPDAEIPMLTTLVKEAMEHVLTLRIPLEVNISVGKNWKEC